MKKTNLNAHSLAAHDVVEFHETESISGGFLLVGHEIKLHILGHELTGCETILSGLLLIGLPTACYIVSRIVEKKVNLLHNNAQSNSEYIATINELKADFNKLNEKFEAKHSALCQKVDNALTDVQKCVGEIYNQTKSLDNKINQSVSKNDLNEIDGKINNLAESTQASLFKLAEPVNQLNTAVTNLDTKLHEHFNEVKSQIQENSLKVNQTNEKLDNMHISFKADMNDVKKSTKTYLDDTKKSFEANFNHVMEPLKSLSNKQVNFLKQEYQKAEKSAYERGFQTGRLQRTEEEMANYIKKKQADGTRVFYAYNEAPRDLKFYQTLNGNTLQTLINPDYIMEIPQTPSHVINEPWHGQLAEANCRFQLEYTSEVKENDGRQD